MKATASMILIGSDLGYSECVQPDTGTRLGELSDYRGETKESGL